MALPSSTESPSARRAAILSSSGAASVGAASVAGALPPDELDAAGGSVAAAVLVLVSLLVLLVCAQRNLLHLAYTNCLWWIQKQVQAWTIQLLRPKQLVLLLGPLPLYWQWCSP